MRSNRPYVQIDPDVLERARQIDLLSYLRTYEPSNLVKVKGTTNVYCTAEHDSLKISNGKWYWWSRGFGGYSALDYLMKVREYGFVEAVEILTGQALADWKPPPPAPKKDEPKVLLLPPKNKDCDRVTEYLFGRGIDYSLIQECIAEGIIFEGRKYHNAVFVGRDEQGKIRHLHARGTLTGSHFRQTLPGSEKEYSFHWPGTSGKLYAFEAPIDLLSYISLHPEGWQSHTYVALCGVSAAPIHRLLETQPQLEEVTLCLDNDEAGHNAARRIGGELLREWNVTVSAEFPSQKDWNDELLANHQEESESMTMTM